VKVRTRHSFRMTRDAQLPQRGFSLIELVITVTVLAILTLGVIPLVQVSVKRQKEEQLRAALREMREAFDQFRREALVGAQMQAMQGQGTTAQQEQAPRLPQAQTQASVFGDPRVRVFITDQTIFGVDNPDRFPLIWKRWSTASTSCHSRQGAGQRGNMSVNATDAASQDSLIPKIKIYLRRIPVDPMTGKAEWDLRSAYDSADANSWGGENVFDVRSKSDGTALNGTKYRDW